MKNLYLRILSTLIIMPLFLYSLYDANYLFYTLIFLILILSFYEIYTNIKQKKICLFLYVILIIFVYSLVSIRGYLFYNYILCIWVLSIVWISDIAGYVVGKIVKGPKLSIYSPNKTISGFLGSIIFSQSACVIPLYFLNDFVLNLKIILIQFFFCIISVIGDIFFSMLKRINNIKDYSNIIPGHGGILDRIDGMIFVIIIYFFFNYFNVL